jgi:hypothetical protein
MIFVARKGGDSSRPVFTEPPALEAPYPDIAAVISKYGHRLPEGALKSPIWTFSSEGTVVVANSIGKLGEQLRQFSGARVFRGLTTGFNEAFVIDRVKRQELISANKRNSEIIKPLAMGRDVTRWHIDNEDRWMIVTPIDVEIKRYPEIYAHLKQWEPQLKKRWDQGNHWWELRACDYYQEFERPKIVSTKVSIRPTFALDSDDRYLGNTAYFLPVTKSDSRYLLALLNSIVFFAYAKEVFAEKQNGWYEVQPKGLEAFPIVSAPQADRKALEKLVDACIEAKGQNCAAEEREIDDRVAALYKISQKDLRSLRKRLSITSEEATEEIEKSDEFQKFLKQQFGS